MAEVKEAKSEKTAKPKTVKVKIPRTRENAEPVFVGVNGRTWLIQRGVEVEVPESVAEVIRHSEAADEERLDFISQNAK